MPNHMMCCWLYNNDVQEEAGFTFKKSRGWFRWCTSGWSCWRETRIPLLILHLTLGFPHFVNSYFKVHFCTSSQKEQQGCCLLFLPDMVMVFTSTLWCFKVWWKMKYIFQLQLLDRSPAFPTSDDFIRSNEIVRTKRLIYKVISTFVSNNLMISSERKKNRW